MAHLRALQLELARNELARAGPDRGSVTSVRLRTASALLAVSPLTTKPVSVNRL
jgi:hypothetical protein